MTGLADLSQIRGMWPEAGYTVGLNRQLLDLMVDEGKWIRRPRPDQGRQSRLNAVPQLSRGRSDEGSCSIARYSALTGGPGSFKWTWRIAGGKPRPCRLEKDEFSLAPDVILTPKGPQRDHVLAVGHGRISRVCTAADYARDVPGRPIRRLPGSAIIPGFVDAHTHLGETFGKALIGGEPSQIWRRIWMPMENALDPTGCYVSAKWMFLEVLRGGHTAVVNYSLNDGEKNAAIHRAAKDTGIRLISAAGVDEFSINSDGRDHRVSQDEIFERVDEQIEQCRGSELLFPSVCCSSFHGNSPGTIASLAEFCRKRGVLFQMHSNEHFPEVHDCILKFGKRPIELFAEIGALGPSTCFITSRYRPKSRSSTWSLRSRRSATIRSPANGKATEWPRRSLTLSAACAWE